MFITKSCITILLILVAVAAIACAGQEPAAAPAPDQSASGQLNVAATVSPITSIVENIGGTRISLQGVVPEGVNSHTFEPAPSVAVTLAGADLIFLNGLFLEEPTLEMAKANLKPGASIVSLGEQTITREQWQFDFSFPEEDGHPNPHLWPDPILALRYAEIVRDNLVARDAANADYYRANYDAFAERIATVDEAVKTMIPTIPVENRKLLTYHDSWAYFADRYGLTVIGAVQPSDFSEPSARDVANLITQISEEGIPAVFGSEVFPSDVMQTIAAESGAEYIDELSDDDLPGAPGDPDHSYLGLEVTNLRIMIPALGGDASALDNVDISPVFDGESNAVYPQ
ncbi:MAG: zinc ABC transporter substrate-binding protein [Chloroflexi bacterium]|nr:zinc ABC transporter substrate-binding protein [Chloroflexota bacterium]MYD46990.1 zinc ABC transporter substrate-binding protein [Chloroflexota bacterium]